GFSVLISMTTGSSGTEAIKETAKMLSSTAFDRNLEKEADLKAVEYLVNASVNPEPFANFLYRLSLHDNEDYEYLSWISTHPDSEERAKYIVKYSEGKFTEYKAILNHKTWKKLKEELAQNRVEK
ncbi:MAG: M48 family metalloprotease, partial [Bacteroidales bacterium]|nr:M48 family metalloprotease [Bacteroidales bacterium]